MKSRVVILALCAALLTTGCGGFFIGLGLLIACGPMPMSADACEGGRGWGFTPDPPPAKPKPVCAAWVETQAVADAVGCTWGPR